MAERQRHTHPAPEILDVLRRVNDTSDLDGFVSALLDGLVELVPCCLATYNEVSFERTHFVSVARPADFPYPPDIYDRFAAHRHEHPVLAHLAAGGDGPLRISDFLDDDTYRASALYREVYEPLGVAHQVVFRLPSSPSLLVVVALSRSDADFDDAERDLLALLRPHLAATDRHLRTAELLARQVELLTGSGSAATRAVVRRAPGGGLEAGDDAGGRLLARWLAPGATLAKTLEDWLAGEGDVGAAQPASLRVTGGAGTLLIRGEVVDDGGRSLVLEEQVVDAAALRVLGLTARQAEVLARLVEGGTNASIAAALGIRPATVKKLLEQVYAALGVHDRRSAVAAAMEVLPPTA